MRNHSLHILIGGEAGQGLVTIGEVLAKALVRHGYSVLVTQSYQSRVRGGHNTFGLRVSSLEVLAPEETVDLLVALNQETVDLHAKEMDQRGLIITDQAFAVPGLACAGCLRVPLGQLADKKTENVAALGVLGVLLGLSPEVLAQAIHDYFGKKPEAREKNQQTLARAREWAAGQSAEFFRRLPPPKAGAPRIMLNGNQAIALGALSAGLKFFAFYPMTPSTTIALTLTSAMSRLGLVVEQAEDELAAVNMAIGASFAGAPAMVGTSGGGFALMGEGVSLAAMTETPLVIAVAQRPAPATGLPTRTEQSDLDFVLHSGHGEFPRALFAPGTVEQCFHLSRKALELAHQSQGPVFILTDQYLADCYREVAPFDLDNLPPLVAVDRGAGAPASANNSSYQRYAFTPTGVSPRLLPGASESLVIADSDEHTADGHLTEDLEVRVQMVDKRQRKMELLLSEVIPPEYIGPAAPDLLLVTWGSSRGSVLEAAAMLRETGTKTSVLGFSQLWPLHPDQFMKQLESARRVVAVEGNAAGQFARLLRRETGFEIKEKVLRYDGLAITPEYILRKLEPST